MILRRPYAFLIKHFKIIHLIIAALSIYIAFCMNDMLGYFNSYFRTNTGRAYALNHINYLVLIAIILSLVIVVFVIWLMRYKNKPRFIYYFYVLLYAIVLILIFINFSELRAIYKDEATLKGLNAIRDLNRISLWFQYFFIVCLLIRGLGFDIKKFNFKDDMNEFQVEAADSEEVEIAFGTVGNNVLERKGRRVLRELKYYYLENKFMILIVLGGVLVVGGGYLLTSRTVTNNVYDEGQMVKSGKIALEVVASYITNYSSNGNEILGEDNSLVIVKFGAKSNNKYNYKINNDYLSLEVSGQQISSTTKYNNYFTDIGVGYKNQYVTSKTKYFLMIYSIPKKYINKKMNFIYHGDLSDGRNILFKLKTINLNKETVREKVNLKSKLNFDNSLITGTSLKVKKYELKDKFEYKYCYLDDCNYTAVIHSAGNSVLKLDIDSKIGEAIVGEKNWASIINNYGKIYYVLDGKTYNSFMQYVKTPVDVSDTLYIEVDKDVEKASSIWLEFKMRNQKYQYVLK